MKLNKDKIRFRRGEAPYIGHLLTGSSQCYRCHIDVARVQRLISVNYLSKFLPHLSDICEPLKKLVAKDVQWHWTEHQGQGFQKIRKSVCEPPMLKYYEAQQELTLQSDASQIGLGAVLTQTGQPLAFASRALSVAGTRYAQTVKELLSVVFGLEKFHQYIYSRNVTVQTTSRLKPSLRRPSVWPETAPAPPATSTCV